MDLSKLFETQRVLDTRIELEHPPVEGEDRLAKKILALQVELGECANEWRGFKFWSNDQEPRTKVPVTAWGEPYKNPLLEEYVDCLHFILSIGLEIGQEYFYFEPMVKPENDIISQFAKLFKYAYLITEDDYCSELLTSFIHLGVMLGFTWEQIEQAYYDKNASNHTRQNTGY